MGYERDALGFEAEFRNFSPVQESEVSLCVKIIVLGSDGNVSVDVNYKPLLIDIW